MKNLPANVGGARDAASVSEWGGSPGGRNGHPLQYSCLVNLMGTEETGGLQSMGSQRVGHD